MNKLVDVVSDAATATESVESVDSSVAPVVAPVVAPRVHEMPAPVVLPDGLWASAAQWAKSGMHAATMVSMSAEEAMRSVHRGTVIAGKYMGALEVAAEYHCQQMLDDVYEQRGVDAEALAAFKASLESEEK